MRTAKRKPVGRYMVLAGAHYEGGKQYVPGDIVDSMTDLNRLNGPGMKPKFKQVKDSRDEEQARTQVSVAPAVQQKETSDGILGTLEGMTVSDLRKLAAEEEIDLGDAKTKEELVKVIHESSV